MPVVGGVAEGDVVRVGRSSATRSDGGVTWPSLRRSRMSEHVPFVVVGGGVMGLSTAWALSRRGERPLVLEQFGRGHTRGASHGATRNFNNAYADEHYLDLLARAREGWDALGAPGGEPLLRLHGLVSHGGGAALGGTGAGLVAIHEQLRARGIAAELLDGAEASRRWPGMRFEDTVLFSPDAGVARASVALEELERRIVAGGGEVRWQTPALRIEEDADGVTVHTARAIRARRHRRRHRRRLDQRACSAAASRSRRSRSPRRAPRTSHRATPPTRGRRSTTS